jgi:pimeloyl-ACP methyl ester carboxylesterase
MRGTFGPRAAALTCVAALAACSLRLATPPPASCAHVQSNRQVRGQTLCEDVWSCEVPPGGVHDRLGVRRVAPCGNVIGPIVLYLPDRHMTSAIPTTDARDDLRLYLAQAGMQTWSLDYRSHFAQTLPADAPADPEAFTFERYLNDVEWVLAFVRGATPARVVVSGFGDGAALAYALAARRPKDVHGLIAFDGVAGRAADDGAAGFVEGAPPPLEWSTWSHLLRTTRLGPRNPSPLPGYLTAGQALTSLLFDAPAYGGNGGLSAAKLGAADAGVLADYLSVGDRWWPTGAVPGSVDPPDEPLPVLAFAAGRRGPAWVARVRAAADAFGGETATTRELRGLGHLDVLLGAAALRSVFEPSRRWIGAISQPPRK